MLRQTSKASPIACEWEALLDEELSRLPPKYRLPIILCDLQGRTRKEVEHQLHLAAGTLSSRLSRAHRLLAERLTRRGLVLAGGVLAPPLADAAAALTPTLVAAIAHQAVLVAAGQLTAIPDSISFLVQAGVRAMFISRLKTIVATMVVLVTAMAAGGLVYSGGGKGQPGQDKSQQGLATPRNEEDRNEKAEGAVAPIASPERSQSTEEKAILDALTGMSKDPKLLLELVQLNKDVRTLLREKRDAAKGIFDEECKLVALGKKSVDVSFLNSSKRLLESELELASSPKERMAALVRHWLSCKTIEKETSVNVNLGRASPATLLQTRYFRVDAEIDYLKEKEKLGK